MNYRLYKIEDYEKVNALCKREKVNFPESNLFLFVAENDQGDIIGICGLKPEWKIEPLISSNPLVGNNLYRMVEGATMDRGIRVVRAEVDKENKKHTAQMEKAGFVIVENGHLILEKTY